MKIIIKKDKVNEAKQMSRILCKLPNNKVVKSKKNYNRQEFKKIKY